MIPHDVIQEHDRDMIWTCYGFIKSWNMIRHFLRIGSMFLIIQELTKTQKPSQTHIETHFEQQSHG